MHTHTNISPRQLQNNARVVCDAVAILNDFLHKRILVAQQTHDEFNLVRHPLHLLFLRVSARARPQTRVTYTALHHICILCIYTTKALHAPLRHIIHLGGLPLCQQRRMHVRHHQRIDVRRVAAHLDRKFEIVRHVVTRRKRLAHQRDMWEPVTPSSLWWWRTSASRTTHSLTLIHSLTHSQTPRTLRESA